MQFLETYVIVVMLYFRYLAESKLFWVMNEAIQKLCSVPREAV